jgi:hypothetical protein
MRITHARATKAGLVATAYEGYCEKAAWLAWARTTHHPTAIDHWRSSDGARHTTGTPPTGAFQPLPGLEARQQQLRDHPGGP